MSSPSPSTFEFNLSVPCESQHADMVRLLAAHGARSTGAAEDSAAAFGEAVAAAFRDAIGRRPTSGRVSVAIRQAAGSVEAVVGDRTVALPT